MNRMVALLVVASALALGAARAADAYSAFGFRRPGFGFYATVPGPYYAPPAYYPPTYYAPPGAYYPPPYYYPPPVLYPAPPYYYDCYTRGADGGDRPCIRGYTLPGGG